MSSATNWAPPTTAVDGVRCPWKGSEFIIRLRHGDSGHRPESRRWWTGPPWAVMARRRAKVDPPGALPGSNPHTMQTLQTSIPYVFAAGDAVSGPATVIEAVAAKDVKAAEAMELLS